MTNCLDSDPPEETPPASKPSINKTTEVAAQPLDPPTSSQVATPDSPPANPPSTSHKKGGRPPNASRKKLGKNQYTKDRDPPDGDERSPNRSQSRDVQRGDDNGHHPVNKGSTHEGKHGKSKSGGSKITMTDMKKRVAAILEFISRTQVEMAGESISPTSGQAAENFLRGIADGLPMIKVNGETSDASTGGTSEGTSPIKEFKDLSCMEMMDVLTRQLVKWQKEFV
jgi:hypothetical protein